MSDMPKFEATDQEECLHCWHLDSEDWHGNKLRYKRSCCICGRSEIIECNIEPYYCWKQDKPERCRRRTRPMMA